MHQEWRPHHGVALPPAWPMTEQAANGLPAMMRVRATSHRHEGKQFRQLEHHKQNTPTLFTHHEVGEALRKERGRRGEGQGEKKEDKVRILNAMPSSLHS